MVNVSRVTYKAVNTLNILSSIINDQHNHLNWCYNYLSETY